MRHCDYSRSNTKCILCGDENWETIHRGTRDREDIDVIKCKNCGIVALSKYPENTDELYSSDGMNHNEYDPFADAFVDFDFDEWLRITEEDDERRYKKFESICKSKNIIDFGCGNGGTLERLARVADKAVGIELDDIARDRITKRGGVVFKSLADLRGKAFDSICWDIVFSFMCIEHLVDPRVYLRQIRDIMDDNTLFICSTPNADEALISYYNCGSFKDFTYWSAHVYLYNEDTLARLLNDSGFFVERIEQVQRYPLSNHLYWLANGAPEGHLKYHDINDETLNVEYSRVLAKMKMCDSIIAYARKKS